MRPVHALVLLVVLCGLLVGALVLVTTDRDSGRVADATPEAVSPDGKLREAGTQLDPTGPLATGATTERTSGTAVPTTIVKGPVGLGGRVLDEEGRPVANADVMAAPTGGIPGVALDDMGDAPWMRRVATKTGADGRFTINPEAQGTVRLAVRADGFAPLDTERSFAGAQGDLGDLRLERGVVLQGRVVDAGGRGVAGARLLRVRSGDGIVFGDGFDEGRPPLAVTDAAGSFRIDRLAAGPWKLRISSEEHPDKVESGSTERPGQVVANLQFTLDPGTEIAGRVTGVPAELAGKLVVRAVPREAATMLVDLRNGGGGSRSAPIDANGSFVVRGCRADMTYGVSARSAKRAFEGGSRSDTVDASGGDRNVVLRYRAETALVFQVVDDATGKPVEDLSVSAGGQWTMPLVVDGKPVRKFPEGRVRFAPLAGLREGQNAQLRVEATGYEPLVRTDLRVAAGVDNDVGVLRLARGSMLIVAVRDAAGAPVVGASVSLNEVRDDGIARGMSFVVEADLASPDGVEMVGGGGSRRAKTDDKGLARVSSFPGQRARVNVRHEGHAPYTSAVLDLPREAEHTVDVTLSAGGVVVVEVVDGAGAPVAGVDVDHRADSPDALMITPGIQSDTVTDAQGKVAFAHLAAGVHRFRVRPSGGGGAFAVGASSISIGGRLDGESGFTEATVVEGETITVRLVAPERGVVTGRVRESGKPLAGATVRLRARRADGPDIDLPIFLGGGGLSGNTNGSGEYTISGVELGEYDLVVTHPARAMPHETSVQVGTGSNRHDVELPLAILEGRVKGPDGKPVAGARVTCERAEPESGDGRTVRTVMAFAIADDEGEMMEFDGAGGGGEVTTDAEGAYRLRGVTPDVKLEVRARAKGMKPAKSDPVTVGADQTRSNVDLVLAAGATLRVEGKNPDGTNARGVMVTITPIEAENAEPKVQMLGPSGKTEFTGLEPGKWKVTCDRRAFALEGDSAPEIPPQETTLEAGATRTLTFQIPR